MAWRCSRHDQMAAALGPCAQIVQLTHDSRFAVSASRDGEVRAGAEAPACSAAADSSTSATHALCKRRHGPLAEIGALDSLPAPSSACIHPSFVTACLSRQSPVVHSPLFSLLRALLFVDGLFGADTRLGYTE
eukprot:4282065-Pleurochrysis_carterae.AAC.1